GRLTWGADRICGHGISSSWASYIWPAEVGTANELSVRSGSMNQPQFTRDLPQRIASGRNMSMATDGTFTTSRAAQRHIGYLPPREMADSSSSSCLISTLSWVSRVAATVSLTSGIDGSWSLSRNSSSQQLSRLLVIQQTRSNVF